MTTVKIKRLGHLGDGIADGPIYVPSALPGEVVSGTLVGEHLRDPKIDMPSEHRVKPPCSHARSCGGCQLQHASDVFVADWKREVVRQALAAQGIAVELDEPITSPARSRRRATFSVKRTKKGALAGFHMKASDTIIAVPNCQLVHPDLVAALPMVEALGVLGASRKGELSVLVTRTNTGLDVSVTGGKEMDLALHQALADLAREYDLTRISWDGEIALQRRAPVLALGPADLTPPPGTFLQATKDGETALINAVKQALTGAKRVADLFAGCGTFALPLAQDAMVHAVEADRDMMNALDHAWRNAEGLKRVTHEVRDLFRNPLQPDELSRFDAVVIDPPRAGAAAQVAEIAQTKIPKIAHVSCNPATFARDTATLIRAGYDLEWVKVVDQFRWSTHVELVALLRWGK
ncbi:methyltransferase [Marivita sp. XM-24bin2]|jgi:23S rRNA (uracil1939-C5)-methyltransferase|uniref:class I SAM-dependent RNA methyltransferase n=1 Tax=unclassified Marivita TaxID=2632480 RepID=UPI000D796D16|nr:methyltransferase [Marivita sp. XM-24bin2]MCR9110189.1 methyltransferase [Paracoccaceae bacterium]PWL34301.1 MAG: class I SAM-dependent RNA methyltransferase [Marivita sp. XM-24bin2]